MFYVITALWAFAVLSCFGVVERYANQPGEVSPLGATWPAASALQPATDKATALIFAHPKCPCTQASIREFQRIEARHPDAFETVVLFTVPEAEQDDWQSTRLVQEARNLRSARVVFDGGGREAAHFKAVVSGQVLLFSREGLQRFSGGVTSSRGHEGDNGGQAAFEHVLTHPDREAVSFPVFGCGLIRSATSEPTANFQG